MTSVTMILISTLLSIGHVISQWPMPSRNMQPPPPIPKPFETGSNSQQPKNFQMYLYNPSIPPAPMPLHHQQSSYQWNNQGQNYQTTNNQQQVQSLQNPLQKPISQRVLVDYPFTVEYIDRSKNSGNSASFYADQKLIDYPFTVEYVNGNGNNNNKPSNEIPRAHGALQTNPDSFRSNSQQQQRHNNFPVNPSLNPNQSQNGGSGTGGYQNSGGGGYQNIGGNQNSGGASGCRHPRCSASY